MAGNARCRDYAFEQIQQVVFAADVREPSAAPQHFGDRDRVGGSGVGVRLDDGAEDLPVSRFGEVVGAKIRHVRERIGVQQ